MGAYVYISYDEHDRDYAERLARFLAQAGVEVWYDPGEDPSRIEDCAAVVVVVPAAASVRVEREVLRARDRGTPLFPVRMTGREAPPALADVLPEVVAEGALPESGFVVRLITVALAPHVHRLGAPPEDRYGAVSEASGPPPVIGGLPRPASVAPPPPLPPPPPVEAWSPTQAQPQAAPPMPAMPAPAAPGGALPYAHPPMRTPPARRRRGLPLPTFDHAPATRAENLAFTAAHPSAVAVARWYPLLVLMHGEGMDRQVSAVLRQWAPRLGGDPATTMATAFSAITRGTTLTLVPSAPGVVFNPQRVEVAWQEDVQEVPFRFQVDSQARPGIIPGQVEIQVGTLPVAIVAIGLQVVAGDMASHSPQETVSRAHLFDSVFASYSRRDQEVVLACAALYQAMGVRVIVDQADLRSGDDWRGRLHSLIARADIFQLYWSAASAASSEVGHEWRYALGLGTKGSRFIRPVYWEAPMPAPPRELEHVHFSRIDLDVIGHLPGSSPLRRDIARPKWYSLARYRRRTRG